jgi:uncharacterized protein YecT (DUF1311 family)
LINDAKRGLMMMLKNIGFVAIFLCGNAFASDSVVKGWHVPSGLSYKEVGISPAFEACMASELGQTVAGGRHCLDDENALQEKRLDIAYKAALKRLSPARAKLLRESQRGWLIMFPNQCNLEEPITPQGGTDEVMFNALCYLDWRADRAHYLELLTE